MADLKRACDAQLYYPALLMALTLPDVCSALSLPKETFVKEKHYIAFVNKYAVNLNLGLDGQSCYRLRGGVVHRGNSAGHPFFGSTHVIFTAPESGASIHNGTIVQGEKTASMFDLSIFCNAMDGAVRAWYADHSQDLYVQEGIKSLISWRPEGVHPFIRGAVLGSGPA